MAVEVCAVAGGVLSASVAPAATTNARKEIIDQVSDTEEGFVTTAKIGEGRERSQRGRRMALCRRHDGGRGEVRAGSSFQNRALSRL